MYVTLVIIAMITAGTIIVLMIRNSEENELTLSVKRSIDLIRTTIKTNSNNEDVDSIIEELYGDNPFTFNDKKIFILDSNANVIYPSIYREQGKRMMTHQIIGAIEDGYFEEPDKKSDLENDDKDYIGIAENVKVDGSVKYIIYGLIDASDVKVKVRSIVNIILVALMVSLLIAIVVAFIFATFITKPILKLTDSARDLSYGKLKGNIEVHSNDEIGQLTNTFNKMARNLNNTLDEIRMEKDKLETVFEHMTDGILVFDKDGKLIHINKASLYMLSIENKSDFISIMQDKIDEDYAGLKDLLEKGTVVRTLQLNNKHFDLYFAKYSEIDSDELGVMCVIQDVTENKRMENLQKEFVANVSHELRTPITTIKTYSETLIDGFEHSSEAEVDFLKTINRESDRMTNIVTDLLSLAKLDNKREVLDKVELDLISMVDNIYKNFSLVCQNTNKSISFERPEGRYEIFADEAKIEQVIKNIVSNAVKYTEDDGSVEIRLKQDDRNYYLEIKDDGFGIPKEDLPRIFERFYRVDKARSREMGGTGLGLSIAKELMQIHGGDIVVVSSVKNGSTFTLIFPKG